MIRSDPVTPKQAIWAVRLWTVSGAFFLVSAAILFVVGYSSTFAIGVGVLSAAVGVAVFVLSRRASTGDPRWRSTIAVFTLTVTVIGMLLSVVSSNPLLLISGLIGLVGSMLAYRPSAEPWFTRGGVGG